jgi:hypothetical protein
MSEYLSFNKSGQWELHKATNSKTGDQVQPKSDYASDSKPYKARTKSNIDGNLPKDNGQKGTLHDTNSGDVPKGGRVNIKQVVKPAREMQSQFTARNPGTGD